MALRQRKEAKSGHLTADTITPNTDWPISKGTKLRNLVEYSGRPGYWYADFYDKIGGNWIGICISRKVVKVTKW
jgi:hypothetical protein